MLLTLRRLHVLRRAGGVDAADGRVVLGPSHRVLGPAGVQALGPRVRLDGPPAGIAQLTYPSSHSVSSRQAFTRVQQWASAQASQSAPPPRPPPPASWAAPPARASGPPGVVDEHAAASAVRIAVASDRARAGLARPGTRAAGRIRPGRRAITIVEKASEQRRVAHRRAAPRRREATTARPGP